MDKKQKPLEIFKSRTSWRILKYFKGIASKKFTNFFRGSLFIYIFLFIFVFMALSVPGMMKPKPAEAEPITLSIVGIVAIGCALAVLGGYIYQNRQAVVDTAKTFLYGLTAVSRVAWLTAVDSIGIVNGEKTMPITEAQVDEVKEFNQERFIVNDVVVQDLPVANFDVYNTGISSPWAPDSCFIYDYVLDVTVDRVITQAVYNEIMELATTPLVWATSSRVFDYRYYSTGAGQDVYKLYINGVRASTSFTYNTFVFNTCYFNDLVSNNRYYYSLAAETVGVKAGTLPPKFILIANRSTNHCTPAMVYQASNDDYYLRVIAKDLTGNAYLENIQQPVDTKDLDIAIDESRALDYDFDIVDIDGNRYISVADDAGQLIGLYPDMVQAREWADANSDAEVLAVETQTNELKSYLDTYFLPGIYSLDYLERLDRLSYDESGALQVTITNADEISGGTSTTFPELDIPQSDFDLPTLELLSDKFPFSIPFDFYNAIANLQATPEAPVFNVNFPAEIFGGEADMQLDFGTFENIAKVIRWVILLGFVISLILITRKLIRG